MYNLETCSVILLLQNYVMRENNEINQVTGYTLTVGNFTF